MVERLQAMATERVLTIHLTEMERLNLTAVLQMPPKQNREGNVLKGVMTHTACSRPVSIVSHCGLLEGCWRSAGGGRRPPPATLQSDRISGVSGATFPGPNGKSPT